MTSPYPPNRSRGDQTQGDQPFQDAKEAMARSDAQIQGDAEAFGEAQRDESEEDRAVRVAAEAEDRLRAVNREIAADRGDRSGSSEDR